MWVLLYFTFDYQILIQTCAQIVSKAFSITTDKNFCIFTSIGKKRFHFNLRIQIIPFPSKFDINPQIFLRAMGKCNL